MLLEHLTRHLHINARQQGLGYSRFSAICGVMTIRQHAQRSAVRDYEAIEAPLLTQYILQKITVRRTRYAVNLVVRCHNGQRSGLYRLTERQQIDLMQLAQSHMHGRRVAPAFRAAVGSEVLQRGQHGILRVQPFSLQALHCFYTHRRNQERVFAEGLLRPAPARIAHHIQHRRVGRRPALAAGLQRYHPAHLPV